MPDPHIQTNVIIYSRPSSQLVLGLIDYDHQEDIFLITKSVRQLH